MRPSERRPLRASSPDARADDPAQPPPPSREVRERRLARLLARGAVRSAMAQSSSQERAATGTRSETEATS